MTIAFHLSIYWVLLPLAIVLYFWVAPRADERGGYLPGLDSVFRLIGAVIIFLVVLCGLMAANLYFK